MKKRVFAGIVLFFLLLSALLSCAPRTQGALTVDVLDVGQGDAVLLSLDGHRLLVDTGSAVSRDSLLGELNRLGADKLDAIIVTHPHEDHYGNARVLLETHTVGALLLPKASGDEAGYRLLLDIAAQSGVEIRYLTDGDTFSLQGALCEVLCPLPNDPEPNNAGRVLRVRYGTCRLLLAADAEQAAENALTARGTDLKCDFLKVGHHGSSTACSQSFLQATMPKIAAISCAADNDYGFPHKEVLDGLAAVGATVYRTDLLGTVRFICDGKSVTYEK